MNLELARLIAAQICLHSCMTAMRMAAPLWALRHGASPAGRITANAGAREHKPATSTINCTVSGTVTDSMDDKSATRMIFPGVGMMVARISPTATSIRSPNINSSAPISPSLT